MILNAWWCSFTLVNCSFFCNNNSALLPNAVYTVPIKHQAFTGAVDQSIMSPQVWSVRRTSSDVAARVINICSLCWLWIFFLPASSLWLCWLRDFEVCHSEMGSCAELYRESFSASRWIMGKQTMLHSCAQRHTDTLRGWDWVVWPRVWNAPWHTGKTCWL